MKNYTITVNGNVYDVTVEEKGAGAAPAAVETQNTAGAAEPVSAEETDVTDDTELAAVIAAAVAASEGTSPDGFVVRSIKRRKSNKWN